MTTAVPDVMPIATKLCELCREGKHIEAIETLYADNVVSCEPMEMPGHPKKLDGKDAVLGKSQWFFENNEIHGGEIKGPYPFDDGRFAAWMSMDITPKAGPMAGQRIQMEEVCLYTVDNGKIVKEEFFYNAGG